VAAPFRLLAWQRGLALEVVVDMNAPDALVADSGRLDQVLRNLLGNAVKFTESGSIALTVEADPACPAPQSSACLRFTVRDTGIGIKPDFLPHIFDSFSQADDSYGKRHGGTGLGLAISRSLVERMGGSITAQSAVGAGSVFTFALCLPRAGAALAAAEPQSPYPAEPKAPRERPLRVLLAEDNEIGRVLTERLLGDAGHTAVSVGNGREALAALARAVFDLVLMDVQMPEMDGLAATKAIRQGQAGTRNADIPIVALTAYVQREDREAFLAAGMDDFVPKPVESPELLAALRRAMGLRSGRAAAQAPPGRAAADAAAGADDPAQAPRFDTSYLERSFGANNALLADMLRQFRKTSLPEIVNKLRQALAAQDLDAARNVAHKAKGTFGAVGVHRASLLAHAAEMAAKAGDAAGFRQHAEALLNEAAALDEHLRLGRPWPEPSPGKNET
jgi:CheY-like chemotaxis protein